MTLWIRSGLVFEMTKASKINWGFDDVGGFRMEPESEYADLQDKTRAVWHEVGFEDRE